MNSVTPAYSVIATIVILVALTLAGFPASVFAQESEDFQSTVTEDSDASTAIELEAESSNSAAGLIPPHPYKIDKLQSDRVYSDFVVGPGRFDLEIAPGESRTVEMIITNRMGVPKTFTLTTEDVLGSDDPQKTVVLLGDEIGPYSVKDFISVPQNRFVLNHGERAHVPVTVSLPLDAEPGGFYGSLVTQIVSDDQPSQGEELRASSKIVSRIGSLFFVTTPGEKDYDSKLVSFSTLGGQKFFSRGPVTLNLVSENTGSVHVRPYGEIRIFNTLGNEVGFVELPPIYILPNSVRNMETLWDRELLVGRYTAVLELNRGYEGIIDKVSYSFWVIPLELVAAIFVGFFIFFIIIRFLFSRFEFKRKDS